MDIQRALRIGIYTGLFTIPFICLIVANWLFFPFITGKNFAFRILVEFVFGLWVALALVDPSVRPKRSLALVLGALFVAAIGVSTALAENPVKAFWSNFERMEGWVTIIHLGMYVTVLTTMFRTEELWKRFFMTSIGVSCIVGIYSIFQLSGAFTINQGGLRVDGTFGNATYFAVYMMIHAFLSLMALTKWSGSNRWLQSLFGLTFIMQSVLVFYSATRGSILGLIGGLFLAGLIVIFSKGGNAMLRKLGIAGVIAILLLAGGFYAIKDTAFVQNDPILSRIATISLEAGATRFEIWNMALQGFKERPLFGWGQEGFNYVFNKYYEPQMYAQEPWFDRAHNVVLDWLVAGGLVGMLLYLSLYAVLVWYLWKPGSVFDPTERALLTGLLAGYAFHNLFVFDNLLSYIMFMALFSYITVRSVPQNGWGEGIPASARSAALVAVLVATLGVAYVANAGGYMSASDLIEGIKPQTGGITENIAHYKAAAARTGLGAQEVGEQYLQFALQLRQINIGDQALQLSVANAARDRFTEELKRTPDDARLQVFFGSFLRQFGDFKGADEHLAKAVQLSPKKQSILFEAGFLASAAGDKAAAVRIFKNAYELDERYEQALILYAAALVAAGQVSEADQLLIAKYGTTLVNNPSMLQAFVDAKLFDRAIAIARSAADKDPKNIQKLVQVAGVYLQAGDQVGAIATLEKAATIDPSFKAQAEQYIQGIKAGTIR